MGKDDPEIKLKRDQLRERIKHTLLAAAAAGHDIEETGSDEEALDMSEDDFFMAGSSGDDADADDEWAGKSPRAGEEKEETPQELVLRTADLQVAHPSVIALTGSQRRPGKVVNPSKQAVKDQSQKFARALMPPPPSSSKSPISSSKSTYNANNKNRSNRSSILSDTSNSTYNAGKIAGHLLGPTRLIIPTTLATRTITPGLHLLCQTRPRDHGTRVLRMLPVILVGLEVARQAAPQAMNAKSSVSDGPVLPTKPKRKRRPKKKT